VVFFEMITRERPFAGNDIATTMYRIAHVPPTPPGQFNDAIGPEVSAVLDRAFAKDPAGRFQTGAEFVAELRRVASPRSAREVSPTLSAMAAAPPPPVPVVVMPTVTPSGAVRASLSVPTPPILPIPATQPMVPPPHAPGRSVLAPIPGPGASQGRPPVSGSDSVPALPVIPSLVSAPTPVMSPTPAVRPAARAGRRSRTAMIGAGGALLLVLAVAAIVFMRGGGRMANQVPPDTGAMAPAGTDSTPAGTDSAPPAPLDAAPHPVVFLPTPGAPAQDWASMFAGTPAPGQPPSPAASSARPRPVLRPLPSTPEVGAGLVQPPLVRPAPAAAPAAVAAAGRVYISTEVDVRPQVVRQVPPVYPEGATAQRVQDVVVLKVLVGPTGRPEEIQVLRGSQKVSAFDAAAVAAVRQWEFFPARKDGQPVACWFNVGVPFQPPPK